MKKSFLPVALGVLAAAFAQPAAAQTVRLFCNNPDYRNNSVVEVNYEARTVTWWGAASPDNRLGPISARITEFDIVWDGVGSARGISYRIDRVSGEKTSCDREGCWPKSLCKPAEQVQRKF